jgi:hypothetical protein
MSLREKIIATTDFAMLSGLIYLLIVGAGRWSVAARIACRRSPAL